MDGRRPRSVPQPARTVYENTETVDDESPPTVAVSGLGTGWA
jgi:hypothetical protein